MTRFAVTPDDLAALDGYVTTAAAHARSAVLRLRAETSALLSTGWQGRAASAFQLGWEQWLEGAEAVLAAMDSLAALVGAAAAGYDETEAAVGAGFARAAS